MIKSEQTSEGSCTQIDDKNEQLSEGSCTQRRGSPAVAGSVWTDDKRGTRTNRALRGRDSSGEARTQWMTAGARDDGQELQRGEDPPRRMGFRWQG